MLRNIRGAKTVRYDLTIRVPGRPDERAVVLMGPGGRTRITWSDVSSDEQIENAADDIRQIVQDMRADLGERLRGLTGNVCCAVDAEQQSDLESFAPPVESEVERVAEFPQRALERGDGHREVNVAILDDGVAVEGSIDLRDGDGGFHRGEHHEIVDSELEDLRELARLVVR